MKANGNPANWLEIDEYLEAFETAQRKGLELDLREFLPGCDDPHYSAILHELIRVDMEYRSNSGNPTTLDDYRQLFSGSLLDHQELQAVAFEEYRQCRERGEEPSPAEYELRYGVDTSRWPRAITLSQFPAHLPRIESTPCLKKKNKLWRT